MRRQKSLRAPSPSGIPSTRRGHVCRPLVENLEDRRLLSVTLSANGSTNPLVGSPITWTATPTAELGSGTEYQFWITRPNSTPQMVQDYGSSGTLTWDPLQEGTYTVTVDAEPAYRRPGVPDRNEQREFRGRDRGSPGTRP